MTRLVFVRHGEPDYSYVVSRRFVGHGHDLAPLTGRGIDQAKATAADKRLNGASLIVSSPYTRALETAAILSRYKNLDIQIQVDLHEWLPDLSFRYSTEEESFKAHKALKAAKGHCPPDYTPPFESLESVFERAKKCLASYLGYDKIIVVSHAKVIRQFVKTPDIPYCGIRELDFYQDLVWHGYYDF
jgi:broad specificity phosphatase PhoE